MARIKKVNHETRDTLAELERTYVPKEAAVKDEATTDKFNAASWSTGTAAASLTSTAWDRVGPPLCIVLPVLTLTEAR